MYVSIVTMCINLGLIMNRYIALASSACVSLIRLTCVNVRVLCVCMQACEHTYVYVHACVYNKRVLCMSNHVCVCACPHRLLIHGINTQHSYYSTN